MTSVALSLKTTKQKLTRQLNLLEELIKEANEYSPAWTFPTNTSDLELFLSTKHLTVSNLKQRLEEKTEKIWELYNDGTCVPKDQDQESKLEDFDTYWSEKQGDRLLSLAMALTRQLDKRLIELDCQGVALNQVRIHKHHIELDNKATSSNSDKHATPQLSNPLAIEQRLLSGELKIPEFHGNPTEFGQFWELFEELVHKQPYSNIGKLSLLLNCCKGDAARSLRMIPRTGDSYERAIQHLKSQYEDPKRVTMQMIRQLKAMKPCREDPRSLRNNLSDIQAIISTIQKQGEIVDTAYMTSMVIDTFSKDIQEEIARKEFDTGKEWSMQELLDNLTIAVKRREHIASRKEVSKEEYNLFFTHTRNNIFRCVGCGQPHAFKYCKRYVTVSQKIERVRALRVCWKCFSQRHATNYCHMRNCINCGGHHNTILCTRKPDQLIQKGQYSIKHSPLMTEAGQPDRNVTSDHFRPINSAKQTVQRGATRYEASDQNQYRRSSTRSPSRGDKQKCNYRSPSKKPQETPKVRFARQLKDQKRCQNINVNLQTNSHHKNEDEDNALTQNDNRAGVRLMIIQVTIHNSRNDKAEQVYALLDSASDQSFITTSLSDRMNLRPQSTTTIIVNTFGGHAERKTAKKVVALLSNSLGQSITVELLTNKTITPIMTINELLPEDKLFLEENIPDKENLITKQTTVIPEILIGIDYFNTIMQIDQPVLQLPSGLFVAHTFFGPVISGLPQNANADPEQQTLHRNIINRYINHAYFEQNVDYSELWRLPGVGTEELRTERETNEQIVRDFYATVQMVDGKIFVKFPWKPNKDRLADNYNLALSRLHQLIQMRTRNPRCWAEYCDIIKEQLQKQFIEDAPEYYSGTSPPYYIPHQAVIKSTSTTTKTRIVLDASSKMKGQLSLNDVVHQGPMLLPNMCGILLRSRIGSKIMIADVEKAFHMIYLQESERDSVRFLWLKDINKPVTPHNIRILRFCRLPFGINASPFLLGISIQYGIDQQKQAKLTIHREIVENLYVDNVLILDEYSPSLIRKYKECKQIFANMSMNLRQFVTNDEACNNALENNDRSIDHLVKILGVRWDPFHDTLSIACKLQYDEHPTKRKVLQSTHSTFDPLGLLSPLLLPAKVFLQDLWRLQYSWDDLLTPLDASKWQTICKQAADYTTVLPRAITQRNKRYRYELHAFVDASIRAFAAVVYLRTIDTRGSINTSFLMARQRLAPINIQSKTMTIPRLELLALLIGARLVNFIIEEIKLNISSIRVYSDSKVALHWLQSKTKIGTFVDNRRLEIQNKVNNWTKLVESIYFHYIPSEDNPADCATKGLTKEQMTNHIWWQGPAFLHEDNSKWPPLIEFEYTPKEEEESATPLQAIALVTSQSQNDAIFANKFSSIDKLRITTMLILKFLRKFIYNKLSSHNQNKWKENIPEIAQISTSQPLVERRAQDLKTAEHVLIKLMQKNISKEDQKRCDNLGIYEDENGILRCRGRIKAEHLTRDTLEPILLLPNHQLTMLLIRDSHIRCGHQGVNATLANLRLTYWVPKARQTVRKYLRNCVICKRWNGKPYFFPCTPPLPAARTTPTRPFSHIGIDIAGPFQTTDPEKNEHKRYILLTTCMTTRAIHLETLNNLSTIQIINGLRRLIARRGKPQLIISDNASNFKASKDIITSLDKEVKQDHELLQHFLANKMIQWKFITPLSPWKGGFYERLIGVMKSVLRKIVGRKSLEDTTFNTIITECEAMVNSRPLAYAGSTLEDSMVIRPIDFLLPYANVCPFTCSELEPNNEDTGYIPKFSNKEYALQFFHKQLSYLKAIWDSWNKNYLFELRNYHQRRIKQKSFTRKQPLVGEVVLIMDENVSRLDWPMGLVTKLIADPDGSVRTVELRTAKSVLERSINMLIPLELDNDEAKQNNTKENEENITQTDKVEESDTRKVDEFPSHNADNIQRKRPFLPRRAKDKKAYTFTTTAVTEPTMQYRSVQPLYWKHWLTIALITTLLPSLHAQNNQNRLTCIKGGINIVMLQQVERIHVCGNEYCMEIAQPEQNISIQFPAEITLHNYQITLKSIAENSTQATHWACPPSPFCEQITCNFCALMISNPDCWPRIAIAVTAILLYMIIITSYVAFTLTSRICRAFSCACKPLCLVKRAKQNIYRKLCTRHIVDNPLIEIDNITTKWSTTTTVKLLAIVMTCSQITTACQQTVLIPTTVSQCGQSNNECRNQTTVLATLNQMQPETCFHMKYGQQHIQTLQLSLQELVLRCRKETLYFTRNTETRVQYQKRCPHMGTCTGSKCGKINYNTLVDELEIANNYTGITYCTESCGGLGCSCGYPSSGCLFYRIYHVPTDTETYEVFQCPSWFQTIKLKLTQNNGSKQNSFNFEIKPYTKKHLANLFIEVTSFSFPALSILNKRFLTNNKTTAFIRDNTEFSFACEPTSNNCIIKDTCKCNPAEDYITCYCTHNNVSQFTQLSNSLPLPIPHGLITQEGIGKIPTIRTSALSINVMILIDLEILEITQQIQQNFQCGILPQAIFGCYNCIKGAITTISCISDKANATAQVSCGLQQFILLCSEEGTQNHIRLFFNNAYVNQLCSAQCGQHTTMFEIKGTLNYINGFRPLWKAIRVWDNNTILDNSYEIELSLPDISHFFAVCRTFLLYTVTVCIVLMGAIIISLTYLCTSSNTSATYRNKRHSSVAIMHAPLLVTLIIFSILKRPFKALCKVLRLPIRVIASIIKTLEQLH